MRATTRTQLKKAQDGTYTIEQSTFPLYGGSIVL